MTKETRQFWDALWIILKTEVAPVVLITGMVGFGISYAYKHRDKIEKKLNKNEKTNISFYNKNKTMNFYNPFERVK